MLRFLFRALMGSFSKPKATQQRSSDLPRLEVKRTPDSLKPSSQPTVRSLRGKCHVIDGDTIIISGSKIRIAGIDAPELEHPWGKKSKYALIQLCKGQVVTATIQEELSYDRLVAKCHLPDGTDLAAELVKLSLALDWPKYSGGEYADFEPADIRKKLWRAAARQKGHMKAFNSEVKLRKKPD